MVNKISFEKITEGYSEEIRELARAARRKIYEILPEVTEVVWERQKIAGYGTGPKKMSEHFSWIQAARKHVVLGFNYGSELPDPGGILEGTGKKFRHFKVKRMSDLDNKHLNKIMVFATTHKVPPVQ